jgi:asparagine synthetase B (glutamine-hydrolysing)
VPNLSERSLHLIAALRRGQRPKFWLDREPAPWLARPFLKESALQAHERSEMIEFPTSSATLAEMHALLRFPFFARLNALLRRTAASEGVEMGAPLSDSRVVRFAGSRPWYERSNMNETKILLRQSMRGLLPDSVLAARPQRTGTVHTYMRSSVSKGLKPFVDAMAKESALAALGIIVPVAFAWCWERYLEDENSRLGAKLLATVQTELWLRGQTGAPRLLP